MAFPSKFVTFLLLTFCIANTYGQPDRSYIITSEAGFVLTDCERQKHNRVIEKKLEIHIKKDVFQVNEVTIKPRQLIIESVDGVMALDKVPHQGSIVINGAGSLQLIAQEPMPEKIEKKETETTIDAQLTQVSPQAKKPSHVRVLLAQQTISDSNFRFFNERGFIIAQSRRDPNKIKITNSELDVITKNGEFYINGNRFISDKMLIAPLAGHIEFGGNIYQGIFNILIENSNVYLVNSIDLEDYIFSVVRSESWPNWPLEVNKVFAIACRSYVIAMAMRAKKTGLSYHIRNTNKHQRYDGFHTCPIIRQAVDETRGVFLAYDEVPIIAMFDSCCGGIIPAHVAHMNFENAPYLARDYACTHCKRCKIYAWETSISTNELEKLLHGKKKKVNKLKSIKIARKDKAGLVKEVSARDSKKTIKLSGKEIYSLLKDVKSYCFTVSNNADTINIKGRGYGHHVGLCQWGAREMVRDGWDYKTILSFYYPGTQFMQLK